MRSYRAHKSTRVLRALLQRKYTKNNKEQIKYKRMDLDLIDDALNVNPIVDLECVFTAVTNNCLGQWPVNKKQFLVTIAKTHPLK